MSLGHVCTIVGAKHVLEQDFEAVGQVLDAETCQAEVVVSLIADRELAGFFEVVGHVIPSR